MISSALGIATPGRPVPAITELPINRSRLAPEDHEALAAIVGAEHISSADELRLRHAYGKSTPDLLAIRECRIQRAPDAVIAPSSHEQVLAVLEFCSSRDLTIVPFGGGTSVVGGVNPAPAGSRVVITIDLGRLQRLLELDEVSRTATLEPGLRGPEAEALLGARGYTLGHFPQSFQYATIGGFAAARSSGQSSAGYRRFDELVIGLRLATPVGTLELGGWPKSAAGPDLRQLVLGSEGAFGVITALTVEVRPSPVAKRYDAWRFDSFEAGREAIRSLAQDGPLPTVLRLSDEAETAINGLGGSTSDSAPHTSPGGCLAIVGQEGTDSHEVAARRAATAARLGALGAEPVPALGESWATGRFDGPYLRDALLDLGALIETLETVTVWSRLPALYEATRSALTTSLNELGTPPVVICHISHVYASGASLYFTVICAQLDDPTAQWRQAKQAASDAILAAGGSITHHHGIGADHLQWFERQSGDLATGVLRAVKSRLDPNGVMNPGVLIR